jgi:hypothetical protein
MPQTLQPTPPRPAGQYAYSETDTLDAHPKVEATDLPKPKGRPPGPASLYHENFNKWDRKGTTYMWIIYFPKMGGRAGEQRVEYGYTKAKDQKEPKDKIHMLKRAIERVTVNYAQKYMKPGSRIEYFRCLTDDNKDNVHLFTILPERVIPEPVMLREPDMLEWLNTYRQPATLTYGTELFPKAPNEPPSMPPNQAVFPDVSKQGASQDPFDESRWFNTPDDLYQYAVKLQLDGHPQGRIEAYYRTMLNKNAHRHE